MFGCRSNGSLDRSQVEALKSLRPALTTMQSRPPIPPGNMAFRKPAQLLSLDGSHEMIILLWTGRGSGTNLRSEDADRLSGDEKEKRYALSP